MDFLTLELMDLTVSQAVLELGRVLEAHAGVRLRILLGPDDMVRHNILRLLERKGRSAQSTRAPQGWTLEVLPQDPHRPSPATPMISALAAQAVLPVPAGRPAPAPLLLTRSYLDPGHPLLGRRLLLGVLDQLPEGTPWLALVLDALQLLEDPQALSLLRRLHGRGILVRVSRECQMLFGADLEGFEEIADVEWQRLLASGEMRLLC